MATVLEYPTLAAAEPLDILYAIRGTGDDRDSKIPVGQVAKDLLGYSIGGQAAAATPIAPATDMIPVARGTAGGKASVDAIVQAGFAAALPGAVAALSTASTLTGTETLPVVQTTAKSALVSRFFPSVVEFSGLDDIFSAAVPTVEADILSQYRMTVHKMPGEVPAYADVCFHWSGVFGAPGGWTIPDDFAVLGAAFDSALRALWGIGPTAQWLFPFLHGTLLVGTDIYPVNLFNQGGLPANSTYSIRGWTATEEAIMYPYGDLYIRIPGLPVPA